MAEENKNHAAQEEMGELFVSIGASGLGGLLKGLGAASAGFLATKTAAETFLKPIKETGKSATEIGKINAQLGGTYEQLQQIRTFFKSKGISEGLIGDIEKLQQLYAEIQQGGAIPENFARATNLLGIHWGDYNSSLESIWALIQRVRKETKDLPKETRLMRLLEIGLSGEWAYVFDRPDFDLPSLLTMKDKDVENTIAATEALNEFNIAIQQLAQILTSKILPAITPVIKKANEILANKNGEGEKVVKEAAKSAKPILSNPLVAVPLAIGGAIWAGKNKINQSSNIPSSSQNTNSINPSSTIPSSSQNTTVGNVTINNHNEIKSDSPSAVVREIENMNGDQVERNLYEISNMPGR